MARRFHRGLLVGISLIALATGSARAADLTNPANTTVGFGFIKVDTTHGPYDNVFNFGTIEGDGPTDAGIELTGSGVVVGDVQNATGAVISATGPAGGDGIRVDGNNVSVGADVENFGLIHIGGVQGTGIRVAGAGLVDGDVANRAGATLSVLHRAATTVHNTPSAAAVASLPEAARGIVVAGSVTGINDVVNGGRLVVDAQASARAFASGGPQGYALAGVLPVTAIGIDVDIGSIEGAVANSGTMIVRAAALPYAFASGSGSSATAVLALGQNAAKALAIGIQVDMTSLPGGLSNSGDIAVVASALFGPTALAHATARNALAYIAGIGGNVAVTVQATATGIEVAPGATAIQEIANDGLIEVRVSALGHYKVSALADAGSATAAMRGQTMMSNRAHGTARGIFVDGVGTIADGIQNDGSMYVTARVSATAHVKATAAAGARAYFQNNGGDAVFRAEAVASGLALVNIGTVDDGVDNDGSIDIAASAVASASAIARAGTGQAFALLSAPVPGNNVGVSALGQAAGFVVDVDAVNGDVTNDGDIDSAAVVKAVVALSASGAEALARIVGRSHVLVGATGSAHALDVTAGSITGSFSNAGVLSARATLGAVGIDVIAQANTGSATAGITGGNGVTIKARASTVGLSADIGTLAGDFANTGRIVSRASGRVDTRIEADAATKALARVSAPADVVSFVGKGTAVGLDARIDDLGQDFLNDGPIEVFAEGGNRIDLSANGGLTGQAQISGRAVVISALATATGLYADLGSIDGRFDNSATIVATAYAWAKIALSATGFLHATAVIAATSDAVRLDVSASAYGLRADLGDAGTGFANTGDIDAVAHGFLYIDVSADAMRTAYAAVTATGDVTIVATADAWGLAAGFAGLDGSFQNDGALDAQASAAIHVNVSASGYSGPARAQITGARQVNLVGVAYATGLVVHGTEVTGTLGNGGTITADAGATVDFGVKAHAGSGTARATVDGTNVSALATAGAIGVRWNVGTVDGSVTNTGDIDVGAAAQIRAAISADADAGNATALLHSDNAISIKPSAYAVGLRVDVDTIGVDLTNEGAILAEASLYAHVTVHAAGDALAKATISTTGSAVRMTGTARAQGLRADVSALAGDFSNTGDLTAKAQAALSLAVSATAAGGAAHAIVRANSRIDLTQRATAYGLLAEIDDITGGFSNDAVVHASANAYVDIDIVADGQSGQAEAVIEAVAGSMAIGGSAEVMGVQLRANTVDDGFTNAGTVHATASALGSAALTASLGTSQAGDATASIHAADTVILYASASATGVSLHILNSIGAIDNSANIDVSVLAKNVASLHATGQAAIARIASDDNRVKANPSANAVGFEVTATAIAGAFSNDGTITANASGALDIVLAANAASGAATAEIKGGSVTLRAEGYATGILVAVGSIGGGFTNAGDIHAAATGKATIRVDASSTASGALAQIAAVTDIRISASATAVGIEVRSPTIAGAIGNTGAIDAAAYAAMRVELTAVAGDTATAQLSADHGRVILSATAYAAGFRLSSGDVTGTVTNGGTVTAAATANVVLAMKATAESGWAYATVTGASSVYLYAQARATGLSLSFGGEAQGIVNTGDVEAVASAQQTIYLHAEGYSAAAKIVSSGTVELRAEGTADGIRAEVSSLDGDFSNTGDVKAHASNVGLNIDIVAHAGSGSAQASLVGGPGGVSLAIDAAATALSVDIATIGGSLTNAGSIAAMASAGLDLWLAARATGSASAHLGVASDELAIFVDATAVGLVARVDDLGGDFVNTGAVAAYAYAGGPVVVAAFGDRAVALVDASAITGYVEARGTGILADLGVLAGSFDNSAEMVVSVSARLYGRVEGRASGSTGSAHMRATTDAFRMQARAGGTGLAAVLHDGATGFANSGGVDVDARAALVVAVAATAVTVAHAGLSAQAGLLDLRGHGSATGVSVSFTGLDGAFTNDASIDAAAAGRVDIRVSAGATSGDASARLWADHEVLIRGEATAVGLLAVGTSVTAGLGNGGTIAVTADAAANAFIGAKGTGLAKASFTGDQLSVAAVARGTGAAWRVGSVGGTVANSGAITVESQGVAQADVSAYAPAGTAIALMQALTIASVSASAYAIGLVVGVAAIGEDLTNEGKIDVKATSYAVARLEARGATAKATLSAQTSDIRVEGVVEAIGMRVLGNSIADGFTNTGDLTAEALGLVRVGLSAFAATGAASAIVRAADTVSLVQHASAYGLRFNEISVGGGFSNDATVVARAGADVKANIWAAANGGQAKALLVSGSDDIHANAIAHARGIAVQVSATSAGFENAGAVTATASAALGLWLRANAGSTATGTATATIAAPGSIEISATAAASGLSVGGLELGAVDNSAVIDTMAVARVGVTMYATGSQATVRIKSTGDSVQFSGVARDTGIVVTAVTSLASFHNSGTVGALASGRVEVQLSAQAGSGNAFASIGGTSVTLNAAAHAEGIFVFVPGAAGAFSNAGTIDATAYAVASAGLAAQAASGPATAVLGAKTDFDAMADARAVGIDMFAGTINGGFTNSGDIHALAGARAELAVSAYGSGTAIARIAVPTGGVAAIAHGAAAGIELGGLGGLTGTIANSATVAATAGAAVAIRALAGAASGSASASIGAHGQLSLTAYAEAVGIVAGFVGGVGAVDNSGLVDVVASAAMSVSLRADAVTGIARALVLGSTAPRMAATGRAQGIQVGAASFGGVDNSGSLLVDAKAFGRFVVAASAAGGDAFAVISAVGTGLAAVVNATVTGLAIDAPKMGAITNGGAIDISARANLRGTVAATVDGQGDAEARLVAPGGSMRIAADATAVGMDIDAATSITGGIANSGTAAPVDVLATAFLNLGITAVAESGRASALLSATSFLDVGATAGAFGLYVRAPAIDGDVTNAAALTVDAVATMTLALRADPTGSAAARIRALGVLDLQAVAQATGLGVRVGALDGDARNSGALDVGVDAGLALTLDAAGASGTVSAYLRASNGVAIDASATAYGFRVAAASADEVENTGKITVDADATAHIAMTAAVGSGDAKITMEAVSSTLRIFAAAKGFGVAVGTAAASPDADVVNSGDVTVAATGMLSIALSAVAVTGGASVLLQAQSYVAIAGKARAVGVSAQVLGGGSLSNSGDIDVQAIGILNIALTADATGAAKIGITAGRSARLSGAARAIGFEGRFDTLSGGFDNTGEITATAVGRLDLSFAVDGATAVAAIDAGGTFLLAHAFATGVKLQGDTIGDDVTNSANVVASALATAKIEGTDADHAASAVAVAFGIGISGTLDGDFRNSAKLRAFASAYVKGDVTTGAHARAVGLDLNIDVTGDVINSGTISAIAHASDATAYGIRILGHRVEGSIQNTGTIAVAVTPGGNAFALDAKGAGGATVFEQRDGKVVGDFRLTNAFADDVEFSGGTITGDLWGGGGDQFLAYAGVDNVLNLSGNIDGFATIDVNPQAATSSDPAVEFRIGGDVTNTGTLNVNAHGTLVVGLDSTVTVTTYNQSATGTTAFEVVPTASGPVPPNGQIVLATGGTANLAGTVQARFLPGLYADNERYLVVDGDTNGGTIIGTYTAVSAISPLLEVTLVDDYVANNVYLDMTRVAFDEAVDGQTRNQKSVAGALETDFDDIVDGTDFGDVVGLLFGLTANQYLAALDDLAGAEHAQMLKVAAGSIRSIDNALMGRLAFLRGLDPNQMAGVDSIGLAFAQVASTGDVDLQMDLAQAEAQAVAAPGDSGVWARVFGSTSSVDGDEEAPGFDTRGGGVALGIDHRLSPDLLVGAYGGYGRTEADFETDANGSVDTYQVGAYASFASGGLHVDGLISGAWQDYDLVRTIDFVGRRARSDHGGWGVSASAQAGYDIPLGESAVVTPMAGIDYVHLQSDGFAETGADSVDLSVRSTEYDSLKSTLGVRITAQIDAGGGMLLVPTASIGWEHEFLDADGGFTASFAGSPNDTTFDIIGSDDGADAAVVSLGLALTSDNVTAFVGYDGKVSADASAHQGTIGIRFGF